MITSKGANNSGRVGSGEASKRRLRRRRAREKLAAISGTSLVVMDSAPKAAKTHTKIKLSHQSDSHLKDKISIPDANMQPGRDEVDRSIVAQRREVGGRDVAAAESDAARLHVQAEREAKKLAKRLAKSKPAPLTGDTPPSQVKAHPKDKNSRQQPEVAEKVSQIINKSSCKLKVSENLLTKSQKSQVNAVKTLATDQSTVNCGANDKCTHTPHGDNGSTSKPKRNDISIVEPQGAPQVKEILIPDVCAKAKTTPLTDKLEKFKLGSEMEVVSTKSKADLRAERRAKQEAQRAAKQASVAVRPTPPPPPPTAQLNEMKKSVGGSGSGRSSVHRVNWFQHLYSERERATSVDVPINCKDLHPAVVRLGTQLSARVIVGSNARCVALLHALKQVVSEYSLPVRTEFARGLEAQLAASEAFLRAARPPAASMTNAFKHIRWQLTQLPNNISEFDAKCQINEAIDTYIRDQIEVAGDTISIAVRAKISHGDNILTYGCSSLVEKILMEAWCAGVRFRAVVVGCAGGGAGGRELLRRLLAHGVPAAYVHISALSFIMRTVHKVVLGAASLLGNGWVLAGAGTAQVALAARACNVPVLVCCETHKFSERVQTDAFVYNEIGEPGGVEGEEGALRGWKQHATLTPLALRYDVTPPTLVTAVVTELAVLPCTSAPVVLRFKLSENAL